MAEYVDNAGYGSNPETSPGKPLDPNAKPPAADVANAAAASIAGVTGASEQEAAGLDGPNATPGANESAAHPS